MYKVARCCSSLLLLVRRYMSHGSAVLFTDPGIFILSFTRSTTENAKLHQHASLGRDIFTLMHKQALTQHPRGEKARIIFSDVAVPKAPC